MLGALLQFPGSILRVLQISLRQNSCKLVAANTGNSIRFSSKEMINQVSCGFQQLITCSVTISIVNMLQSVQVKIHDNQVIRIAAIPHIPASKSKIVPQLCLKAPLVQKTSKIIIRSLFSQLKKSLVLSPGDGYIIVTIPFHFCVNCVLFESYHFDLLWKKREGPGRLALRSARGPCCTGSCARDHQHSSITVLSA